MVTPGAAFTDALLTGNRNNYLVAVVLPSPICGRMDPVGMAFADVTTGEFRTAEVPLGELSRHISSLAPAELLVQHRDREALASLLTGTGGALLTGLEDWIVTFDHARDLLLGHFRTKSLKGFGLGEMTVGVAAAGALLHYLRENQKSNLPHMGKITPLNVSGFMTLDTSTRRNSD